MTILAALLLAALSRAEILDRLRAGPIVQTEGLVQVWADCPADMRREYQLPTAAFIGDICKALYQAENKKPIRFADPGIVVHIGSTVTNNPAVIVRGDTHRDGTPFVRFKIPAPGFVDLNRLRIETVKAFYATVLDCELDDAAAWKALRAADPELRVEDDYAELAAWRAGERGAEDDAKFLKLQRSVLQPGRARKEDVLTFASRLYLFPTHYDFRFAGKYERCTFEEAIPLARIDPCVRFAAFMKIPLVALYGGGRGPKMDEATAAYVEFLRALAAGEKSEIELKTMLLDAEDKLKGVLE